MSQRPTWDGISSLMEAQDYKCVRKALPSTLSNPSSTYLQDIQAVREAIVAETTQGRNVVVVVHSYGGIVGCSAIKGLTRPKQEVSSSKENPFGHVVGIVMIATGFVQAGLCFLDGFGGKPPPQWKADLETGFATIVVDPRDMFYHDLPMEEGNYWVERLTKQALKPMMEGGEHSYEGWRDVPVWFLATVEDKGLPIQTQRYFVQAAKDTGADITLREINSSHSPMLSRPKETADFILEAVASFIR
jgi:pimeloyl-ACP methyl ester carboxylesterase